MTEEQYKTLQESIGKVLHNQGVIAQRLDIIENRVQDILNNQVVEGDDFHRIIVLLKEIKQKK